MKNENQQKDRMTLQWTEDIKAKISHLLKFKT